MQEWQGVKEKGGYTVFIAADIEGTTGYVNWPEKPPEELCFMEQMTAEVNAAIRGALAGGATDFIVSDIHWRKQNIIPGRLAGGASLISGTKRRLMWMDLVERSNLVFFIGFHAGCGRVGAVLPHTIDTRITGLRINGVSAGEAFISAATAGCFGVPVGLATGDRAFIDEVAAILPGIETVAVKEGLGNCSALNLHPQISLEKIERTAEEAAKKGLRGEFQPFRINEPVEMVMEVCWPGYADALTLVPGVRRCGGREVAFTGGWLEALGLLSLFANWITTLPGLF